MPIPIEDFMYPKFIKYKTRYPISENKKDRFYDFSSDTRSYRSGDFPQPGYNPNHNSTRVEKVRVNSDDISLKPY